MPEHRDKKECGGDPYYDKKQRRWRCCKCENSWTVYPEPYPGSKCNRILIYEKVLLNSTGSWRTDGVEGEGWYVNGYNPDNEYPKSVKWRVE